MTKKIFVFTAVLATVIFVACSPLDESIWAPPAMLPPGTPLELHLTPGTFKGIAPSFYDELTVAVKVDYHRILEIEVVEHHDTPSFAYGVFDQIIPDILEFNSTGVDIVSGATVTSRALVDAVEKAMYQAGADMAVLRTFNPPIEPSNFEPGVYHAVGQGGFGGNIYLDVTFDDQWITDIQVTRHTESPGFADSVMNHLAERILLLQHPDIDVITDATITTNAFLSGVRDAIGQATKIIDITTEATTGATQ